MNAFSKKKRADDATAVSFFGHSTISSYTVLRGCGSLWRALSRYQVQLPLNTPHRTAQSPLGTILSLSRLISTSALFSPMSCNELANLCYPTLASQNGYDVTPFSRASLLALPLLGAPPSLPSLFCSALLLTKLFPFFSFCLPSRPADPHYLSPIPNHSTTRWPPRRKLRRPRRASSR